MADSDYISEHFQVRTVWIQCSHRSAKARFSGEKARKSHFTAHGLAFPVYDAAELHKAHQENDRAVMQAYGFDVKTMTESSCVAELMKMYQKLVGC